MSNAQQSIHRFEAAGLGLAPFRYLGFSERRGPIKLADGSEVGSPGQPMGTCAYCGQGIAICCEIRSADGRQFIVGSDCVEKVGDSGLRQVKVDVQRHQRASQKAREAARIEAALGALKGDEALREHLGAQPHPNEYMAQEKGLTMVDYFEWMAKNAGHTGKLKLARKIEKIQKGL